MKTDTKQKLFDAIEKGDLEFLKETIKVEEDLNFRYGQNGFTMLHLATTQGHLDIVKYLVENGADINALDVHNFTAKKYAKIMINSHESSKAIYDYLENAKSSYVPPINLEAAKASIDSCNEHESKIKKALQIIADNETTKMMYLAIFENDIEKIKSIQENFNINHKDTYGSTPLHIAAALGRNEIIEYFLSLDNVSLNSFDQEGNNPTRYAIAALKQNVSTKIKSSNPLFHALKENPNSDIQSTVKILSLLTGQKEFFDKITDELSETAIKFLNKCADTFKKYAEYLEDLANKAEEDIIASDLVDDSETEKKNSEESNMENPESIINQPDDNDSNEPQITGDNETPDISEI
ncbi:MAG TPA: ankyrin repeat domain-containing protein [Candidatus Megaira endosymbiont of Nemacystus decipiens]|nr:ankyrin repeat domain-containing protein [Candidatus Megaera endosymbiont of Nemacystus decipiens]